MKTCAAPAAPKVKFNMKIHLPAGEALKAKIAAMKATKAIAKDTKKAVAKDTKKQTAKDPKKDNANDGKEGRNDTEGVLDLYIENLDLVKRDPSNINTGVSSKAVSKIEKTFSNLSMDQV